MPTPTERHRDARRLALRSLALLACLALLAPASPATAQPAIEAPPAAEAASPVAPAVPEEMQSPRRALRAFLSRMARDEKKRAAELLDLSDRNPETVASKGPVLAYQLYYALSVLVDSPVYKEWPPADESAFDAVPDASDAESPWSIVGLERYADPRSEAIELARDDDGRWRFSRATVERIEALYVELEEAAIEEQKLAKKNGEAVPEPPRVAGANGAPAAEEPLSLWLRRQFPEPLRRELFLLPNYQWLCLLLLAVLGRFVERVGRAVLTWLGDAVLGRVEPDFDDTTFRVWKPVGRLLNAATWYYGAKQIGLPLDFVDVLLVVLKLVTIVAAVLAALAVIDLVAGYFSRRAKRNERRFDDLVVPLAASTAKLVAGVAGLVGVVAAFSGQLPSTLLGGLGIGGLAIALASQETLSNFFGSITVLFDRPFEVGDWVVVEGIEGEVESVGFRSTRLRTAMNSQVTLPNSKLAAASVDNWGRRRYRRYLTRLGVEYDTPPERIEAFCEGIRELIRRQPHTRKDFYAAYFNDFGASALEVLLVVYFEVPDWPTELRERHRLLADIVRLAQRLGVGFAFPTQTVHLHQSDAKPTLDPLSDAEKEGQQLAADIAGELLNYQDRPGKVKFPGPTPTDGGPQGA